MRALIDADSLLYSSCCKFQNVNPFDETKIDVDIEMLKYAFKQKIKFLLERIKCKDYILFISGEKNFRYSIFKEYKATRKSSARPLGLTELREYCSDNFNTILCHKAEADDYVVDYKLNNMEDLLVAIDKDVLNSVEGTHYNYWKEDYVSIDRLTSIQWPYLQTLTGDGADNIIGLKGVGPKTAKKLLQDVEDTKILWEIVVNEYKNRNRSKKDAIMNMRLVRMDQFDTKTKKLVLWKEEF